MKKLTNGEIKNFQKTVSDYFKKHGRTLPWRGLTDPYRILVSEIMLQQTQVDRVISKFSSFIKQFSNFKSLANAPLQKLLQQWQGLGYNRRALSLQKTAQIIVEKYNGKLPSDIETLQSLPGIGPATAASIAAFAFNKPVIFIETNVRTVFIHHFFKKATVTDDEIASLVKQTVDKNPRRWYAALMDYGSMLKKLYPNPSRRSAHYTKQSKFEGSNRQIRGRIIRTIAAHGEIEENELLSAVKNKQILRKNLSKLQTEGFLTRKGKKILIADKLK